MPRDAPYGRSRFHQALRRQRNPDAAAAPSHGLFWAWQWFTSRDSVQGEAGDVERDRGTRTRDNTGVVQAKCTPP